VNAVPLYFFHFSDGKRLFRDGSGHELNGMRAARVYATRQVRELKAAMCDPHIQDLSGWTMTVVDAAGKTVFTIGFDLKPCADAPFADDARHGGGAEAGVLTDPERRR
jgi:hypothetical protein